MRRVKPLFWLVFLVSLLWCQELTASAWRKFQLKDATINVEIVTSPTEQRMGLGDRDGLEWNTGMLFMYRSPREVVIWMKRMRFPIDILWIRQGKIVHIEKRVPPPAAMTTDNHLKRYGIGVYADQVLELPSGFADRLRIKLGDTAILSN